MMRNLGQTIGSLTDKQGVLFIASVDTDGFPNRSEIWIPVAKQN